MFLYCTYQLKACNSHQFRYLWYQAFKILLECWCVFHSLDECLRVCALYREMTLTQQNKGIMSILELVSLVVLLTIHPWFHSSIRDSLLEQTCYMNWIVFTVNYTQTTTTTTILWLSGFCPGLLGSGISWAICKSAPCPRHITMPAFHHSVFLQAGCPFCRPSNSVEALKAQ